MYKTSSVVWRCRQHTGISTPPDELIDVSRTKQNGTFSGAGEPDWEKLPSGIWVMHFDGTDDLVQASRIPQVTVNGWYSVSVWVSADSVTALQAIWTNSNGAADRNCLGYAAGVISFETFDVGYANKSGAIAADGWHHYVCTNNGGTVNLYIDAVAQSGTATPITPGTTAALRLGRSDAALYPLDALITAPVIWSVPLTADQVYRIFQAERGWFGV